MDDTQIHSTLMRRVEALETIFAIPVAYPGHRFDQNQGKWIKVTQLRNTPSRIGLALRPLLQRRGFLQLDLFTPPKDIDWQIQSDAMASKLLAHLLASPEMLVQGESLLFTSGYLGVSDWDKSGHWRTEILIEYLN